MTKPISQRGFEIYKSVKNGGIDYLIDNDGFENITIFIKGNYVAIRVNDGKIIGVRVKNSQADITSMKDDKLTEIISDNSYGNNLNMPIKTNIENFEQAKMIYNSIIKLLDVKKKIRKYVPKYSSESELTIYNLLHIENAREFESKLLKKI